MWKRNITGNITTCVCVCVCVCVYLHTHIGVWSFISSRAWECDKFVATFMDHKTAHWQREKDGGVLHLQISHTGKSLVKAKCSSQLGYLTLPGLSMWISRPKCRALKCQALRVTVTHFSLLSCTLATHCISHAETNIYTIFNMPVVPNMYLAAALTMEPAAIKHVSSGVLSRACPIKKKERGFTIVNQNRALLSLRKI